MSNDLDSPLAGEALALLPMIIPGLKTAVLPAGAYHGGIPLSIYSAATRLRMEIDPFLSRMTTLAAGDSIELWANGKATSVIRIIEAGQENNRLAMELPWGWLVDGLNTLSYKVTRVSGNIEESQPVLKLLFHSPASGITVSHPDSIEPTQPATFALTRTYPHEYDYVELIIGSWRKTIAYVHPANPITYTLTAAERQEIGKGSHPVSARVVDQLGNSAVSPVRFIDFKQDWEDHYTSLADGFNGWNLHTGARAGSIRAFRMNNKTVTAFFNFTDQGAPTGFAGVVLYRDFACIPGQYRFTFEGTHVADSPQAQLVNPILCADTGMAQWRGDKREVPKNGIWYLFLQAFTITEPRTVRLYISNFQDGSFGNDFGIRNINVVRLDSGGGIMSAPAPDPELPLYTGAVPELDYP